MMMEWRSVSIELCPALYFGCGFDDNQLQSQHTSSYRSSLHQQPRHFRPISPRQEQGFLEKIFKMYFTDVPADHRPPHALLCVELCVSAELHRTVFMRAQQHSSGSLDTCLRQKIAQNSGSLHVNSQDSGVTTKVLFLSTWPQFISSATTLQHHCSQIIPKPIIIIIC